MTIRAPQFLWGGLGLFVVCIAVGVVALVQGVYGGIAILLMGVGLLAVMGMTFVRVSSASLTEYVWAIGGRKQTTLREDIAAVTVKETLWWITQYGPVLVMKSGDDIRLRSLRYFREAAALKAGESIARWAGVDPPTPDTVPGPDTGS
jgi:hypothetical protein